MRSYVKTCDRGQLRNSAKKKVAFYKSLFLLKKKSARTTSRLRPRRLSGEGLVRTGRQGRRREHRRDLRSQDISRTIMGKRQRASKGEVAGPDSPGDSDHEGASTCKHDPPQRARRTLTALEGTHRFDPGFPGGSAAFLDDGVFAVGWRWT